MQGRKQLQKPNLLMWLNPWSNRLLDTQEEASDELGTSNEDLPIAVFSRRNKWIDSNTTHPRYRSDGSRWTCTKPTWTEPLNRRQLTTTDLCRLFLHVHTKSNSPFLLKVFKVSGLSAGCAMKLVVTSEAGPLDSLLLVGARCSRLTDDDVFVYIFLRKRATHVFFATLIFLHSLITVLGHLICDWLPV